MIVLCSGGFDPLHVGHLEYLQRASCYGDVVVALNSDEWLVRKKGYAFMPWLERARILEGLRCIKGVVTVDDADGSVCAAIRQVRPDMFAKGGDRTAHNCPEFDLCRELGIRFMDGLGNKVQSSSTLVSNVGTVERAWGTYRVLHRGERIKVKVLDVMPGKATSLQRHQHRSELWVYPDGSTNLVNRGEWHQLRNDTDKPMSVVEVQIGDILEETDIERDHTIL